MNALPLLRQHGISYERSDSRWVRVECPACRGEGRRTEDRTLSLNWTNGKANCFRCGWQGEEFNAFLRLFAIRPTQLEDDLRLEDARPRPFATALPSGCVEAWQDPAAVAYLTGRGLTREWAEYYGILSCTAGPYAQRVIVPICDHTGQYRTFIARSMSGEEPKYRCARGSMISKLVYGLGFPLLRQQSSVYLVEGVFDVFHCWPRAVGTFGKHLSQAQVNVLRTVGVQEVYLLWDAESWQTTPDLWDHAVKKL